MTLSFLKKKKKFLIVYLDKKAGFLAIGLDTIKLTDKKPLPVVVAKGAKSLKATLFFRQVMSLVLKTYSIRDLEKSTGKNNVKYVGILSKF